MSSEDPDQGVWDSMWVTFDKVNNNTDTEQGGVPAQQAVQLAASVVEQQQQMVQQMAQQNEMILKATLGMGRAAGNAAVYASLSILTPCSLLRVGPSA